MAQKDAYIEIIAHAAQKEHCEEKLKVLKQLTNNPQTMERARTLYFGCRFVWLFLLFPFLSFISLCKLSFQKIGKNFRIF